MTDEVIFQRIAKELGINFVQVSNTCRLLDNGDTIPFIARYRKEATGSLDEVTIESIRDMRQKMLDVEKRRTFILNTLEEEGAITDELRLKIENAETLVELEDLYLPYKPKRKTRASIAKEKGLEPLADIILRQQNIDVKAKAEQFVNEEKGVLSADDAIHGASDIIAERINEDAYTRSKIRNLFNKKAHIVAKVAKGMEDEGNTYSQYFDYDELLTKAPSHRILAVFRGENEKILKLKIRPDEAEAISILDRIYVRGNNESSEIVRKSAEDSYDRLLAPSIETEIRAVAKEKADKTAIAVFADNLRQLLMAPPLHGKNVLAIDPGFRTGCKVTVLNKNGKLLHNDTIYPHPPEPKIPESINKILNMVEMYDIDAIAIGNGTAGRETENFIKRIRFPKDIVAVMVNESGASVYSASKIARDEFPEYDVTVRGSVSIGRRLIDPLAELVKIDPKSIGVGQYQHDVNQTELQKCLQSVVDSCVNAVGVDVNTASKELLVHISGLGPVLAQNIIDYRNENGDFKLRSDLKKVKRFGDKAFEQSAGFLRISGGANPLDNSAVHPESYHIVEEMASDLGCDVSELISNKELINKIEINKYVTDTTGLPTLNDIKSELEKPGRDPRCTFDMFEFDKNVKTIDDVKPGMILPGIITNITSFGAFVDIGIHEDGLVHISQMADRYVSDPNKIVKLNQKVMVKVLEVDTKRKRISLSMKK
ncbi:MAG: RNA-binding transcriptional accessory protein [Bacteroidales bacterium]|nr:RNA-binding transcriptional accessory protein [Bacteroidales bacterium]MBP5782860.1 RNA-binding transcriptional accessory protein [Bacteroidales bacterium]